MHFVTMYNCIHVLWIVCVCVFIADGTSEDLFEQM